MLTLIVISLVIFTYLGMAFGFLMMTYNIPSLSLARRIYIYMPYITFMTTYCILLGMINDKEYKKIIPFIFMKNKMLVAGLSMVKVATEFSKKHTNFTPAKAIDMFKYISYKHVKKDTNIQKNTVYQTHIKYTKALGVA